VTAVQNAVVAAALADKADGHGIVVDPNTDIDFGTWSNGTFTVLSGAARTSANAIRVRCAHTAAKGNGVELFFGALIGISSSDVTAQGTAKGTQMGYAGFIGYAGITAKNNEFAGGYKSSVTTTPTQASADSNMRMGTNSFILGFQNDILDGDPILGPGATVIGFAVQGTPIFQGSAIPTPAMPTWSPGTNPGSIPQAYTASSNTTLPGGTYWFTSLTINANLTFSGPAVVYVNGNVNVGGVLTAASGIPADLTIYQYGNNTFGDSASNGLTITAKVIAPGSNLVANNNLYFAGSGIFNTILTKNNALFYYDETQGAADGSYSVSTVN
jgi:hypothetical protein